MASQTDKKEEFRKYLEKGKVLHVLTTVLTDLFEMDSKPDDPLSYLHQRFGESLSKPSTPPNGPQKDLSMSDPTSAPPADPGPSIQIATHHSTSPVLADQTSSQTLSILQHNPLSTNTSSAAHPAGASTSQVNNPAPTQAPVHVTSINPGIAQNPPVLATQIPIAHAQPASTSGAASVQSVQPPAPAPSASPSAPAQVSQPVATNPAPVQ